MSRTHSNLQSFLKFFALCAVVAVPAVLLRAQNTAFTQEGSFTGSDTGPGDGFANVMALSGDGNTALVGASGKNNLSGTAYVFSRSGRGFWSQQQELTAPDAVNGSYFGVSVALSGDGNTAIVGANGVHTNGTNGLSTNGSAYVFVRSGSSWTLQTELTNSDSNNNADAFGSSVSLSSDGNTALVGAPNQNSVGDAYVFTRSGTSWSQGQQITVATSSNYTYNDLGLSVALSGDSNTAFLYAFQQPSAGQPSPVVYVFTRSGATWTPQASLAISPGSINQAQSISVSSDGNTALVGACNLNPGSIAAVAFTRSGSLWSQQQPLSLGTGYTCSDSAVALSATGTTAIVGGLNATVDSGSGVASVFDRSGTTWTLKQQLFPSSATDVQFGQSVALSADNTTALIGENGIAHAYFQNGIAQPTVISVSPSTGSGASQVFTGVYSDPNDAIALASVRMLFNTSANAANACYVAYFPSSNFIYLISGAGTQFSAPVVPGSSTTVSNSQCTLSGSGSSYNASGHTATLAVALTFAQNQPENIYLLATDKNGSSSGWVQEGSWGSSLGPPVSVSVTPSSGTGTSQTFGATYSDPNGVADFATVRILFNSKLSGTNSCEVVYNRVSNVFYFADDAGQLLLASPVIPGSTNQVSNSQCTLFGAGSSYNASGNTANLNVSLTFTGTKAQNIYLEATENNGTSSGWTKQGTWTP